MKNGQADKTMFSVIESGFHCALEKGLESYAMATQVVLTENSVLAVVGVSLLGGLELVELEHVINELLLALGRCARWV